MKTFITVLLICLLLLIIFAAVYLFLTAPSTRRHKTLSRMMGKRYAHRGLYDAGKGIPENTLAAFSRCIEHGFGFEFDVRMTSDKKLVIMHDNSTLRMTGVDAKASELTAEQLRQLRIGGTDEVVPYFSEVLELVSGRIPLIVEIKTDGADYREVCAAVAKMLDGYSGDYVIESFDPRAVKWYRKNRPDIARGQLTEHFNSRKSNIPKLLGFIMHNYLSNFLTRPDFLAMRITDRYGFTHKLLKKLFGANVVVWTAQSEDELLQSEKEGCTVIFEHFTPQPGSARF